MQFNVIFGFQFLFRRSIFTIEYVLSLVLYVSRQFRNEYERAWTLVVFGFWIWKIEQNESIKRDSYLSTF